MAVRALAGRSPFSCGSTTSTAGECDRASPSSSSPTSPRWAWTGTDRSCASPSAREHYADAIARLDADGALYPCFCTRAEIRQAASAPHGALPEGSYPGTCRELTRAERAARAASGRPPALRLRAGAATVAFTDRLLGHHEGLVDDLVVRRNDGVPAYNLAVVVDDTAAEVGEVVRGADLIETTPRQLHVAARLGLAPPATPMSRSCSAPTVRAWPSAMAL